MTASQTGRKILIYADPVQVNVTLFFNEEFYDHVQAPFHPESPERLKGIVERLRQHGLWKDVKTSVAGNCEHLQLVHDEGYIDLVREANEFGLTMETIVRPETYGIAALAAECAIDAAVYSRLNSAPTFALTRPPGHHAGPDYGMGFCYFNNIAIAAEHLLKEGDRRIAIVDLDVHHGNGTEHIFGNRADILYISTHQAGIFPGTGNVDFTGTGEGRGFTVNLPLPSGCGDSTFHAAYSGVVIPILRQFRPDALLVSFGADAHYREPLASLSLSSEGYLNMTNELLTYSKECGRRVTFLLEGGYDIPSLSEVAAGIVGAFDNIDTPLEYTEITDDGCLGRSAIERCIVNLSEYWDL